MSQKIFVRGRDRITRANGVGPPSRKDSRNAASFPAPETSAQTCPAAAIAA